MKEMDTESPDPSSFYNRQHGRLHTVFKLSEHHSLPGTSGTTPMMATNLVKREERKSGCENNGASRSTLPPFEETNTAAYKDTHSLSTSALDVVSPLRKTSGFTATSPTRRSSACGFLRKGEVDLRTSNVPSCSPSSSLQEILGSSPSKTPQFHARDNENKVLFDHSGIVSKPETSSLVSPLSLSGAGPSAKRDQPTVGNSQPKKPLPKYVHRPKSKIEDIVRNLRVQKSLTDDTFSFTKPDISSTSPSSERTARDILDQSISGKTNHDCLQDKKECASESVSDRCINNEGTTDKSVPTLSSDKCCLPRTSPIESACVNRDGHERVNLCVETGAVDKKALDKTSAKEANNLTKPTRTEPAHTAATKVSRKEDCNEGRCEEGTKAVLEETGISSEPKDQSKVEETARKCLNESSQKSAGSSSGKVSPSLTGDSPPSVTGSRDSSSKSISKTCSRKSNDLNARSSNRETKAASSKIGLNGQLGLQDGHENTVGVGSPSSRRKDQSKKHVHSVPNKKPASAKSDSEASSVVSQRNSSKPSKTDSSIKTRTPSSGSDKGKHTKSKIVSGNVERKQLKSESSTKAPSSFASKSTVQETVNLKTCNKVPGGESKKSNLPIANESKVQKYNSLFPDYLEDISSESDFDDDRVEKSSKPTNVFATSCLGDELEDISSAPDSMDEDSGTAFDMADKLKKQSEIHDAKSQGDELNNSSSGKDSSSLHKSNITLEDKDFQHNRTSSSSKTDLSSLSSDVQSLSLQDSVISEDSCEDSRLKCVQLLKELMLAADDVGVKVCSNRNSMSLQPCLPCRLPLTKVSQALENYSKTSKSSCRTSETPGDVIKPLNMPEISEKESTPDVSESPDRVTLSGVVSEVVDSTDTAGTLADVTEMPCSIAEPSTPVIPLSQEGSSDIADASVYFNGITDSSERTGILEDPFVAPNTVPNISETPATLTDLSEITDVLADLSESSDPLMELSETSNSLVELPESADALAVLPAISVALDCSSEISSSLADLPVTTDSLENLSGTDNIHPSLPEISDSLGCTSEISSVIEDLRAATNSLDSQPDETINVLPLLPEMSDTLDSSCEAVNILTNLPETVDPLDNSPGITDVLSVLPKISSTVADLSEAAHSFPVSSKGTNCFPDKSQTGDISFDSSKADGITEEPETLAASNNNSETRSPFIESSSETTAASNDSSETRSPFIDSSSETNVVNGSSTSGAEVTKSKDSTDIAINISLPLDSLLELPKPAYPVLEEEHKGDETELSSASLHEEVSDGSSRVHNKESRLLGISSLASDIGNVDHGSPTKLKTPMEICDVSPDTKAVVPPEVNNVPPEASATSSDSLLSSDKTNQSRVVSPSNKFLFQIGKEHHMKLDDGQKLFACDICSGVYQRAFSLKRHYLRSHINYRYLTERDISNCGIITGDKMALQSENNTKICMQNSKITSVSDSESSRDVPVSSTFIDDEVSGLLQDNTRVLSESEVIAKETTSNETEKPDINEVENVKTVGALNVLSNPMGLYRCHTCGECFEEKCALKVHLKNHPIPLSVGPSGESKSFSCTRCNATFSHKNNYLRHCASLAHNKQSVIVASGSKKAFLCLYCNKEFTSVAIRKRHQSRIHQNQKKLKNRRRPQHACPFCPKSKKFRDLSLVMKHCLSEHGDDYHVCTTCPERFPSKQILNEHVKEEHTKLKTKSVKVEKPVNNAVDIKSPGKEITEPKGVDSVISNTGKEQEEVNQLENVPLLERKKNLPVNREGNKEQQVPTENNFRYKCSVCQKMFTNYVNLSRHNRLAHRTVSSSKKSKNSSQSSSCTDTLSSPSDGSRSQSPLVTSFVPVNAKKSLPKQSQATPRLVQNTQSNLRLEGTVDERTMDPETLFYSRLSCNIRDNLLNHLDGKLHSQSSVDQCEESVCASLEVDSREESTSQDSNVISMSSLSNTNELLEDDNTNKTDSKERSPKRKTGGNTVHRVFWEKYNFPKNYDGRGGGLTSYIKDMSHLDIHTQLTMRQNLQRMNSNSSDSSEDMPLSRMVRNEASGKDNVVNFPAELCLIENVSNKQKSQNSKASSLTSKLTRESRRVTRRTSELEQKEKEAALEREAKSNSSSRRASTEDSDSNAVVLSGEWVRPRSYICAACSARFADLWDLEDHKYSVHPNVWCTHYEFDETSVFGNAGGEDGSSTAPPSLPVDLCPRYLLSDGALQAAKIIPVTVASDSKCTKCGRSFNTLPDLHRHMLECGGDTTWMLTMLVTSPGANNRRNRKWRPFGSRRRRQQGRRGMKRNIPSTPVKIPHYRPRHRGNDSDSIQRMIANLPPKRSTRRVIQFSEDEIKTRSQGTIHSNRLLRKRYKVPFVPNLTRPTYKSGICRSSYGRIISSPDRKHSQALKKRAVSIASGAGSSQRAKARKFLRSQSEGTVARAQAAVPLDLYTAGPSTSKGVLRRSTGNIPNSSREGAKGGRVARRNKNASANSSVSTSPLTVVEDKVSLPASKALVVSRGRSVKRLTISSEVRSLSTGPDTIIARITRNVKRSMSLDQAKVTRKFPQDSIAGLSGGGAIEPKGKALKALDNVKGKVARSKTLTTSSSEVSKLGERRSKHFSSRVIETGMTIPRDNSTVLSAVRLAILEKSTTITQGMFEVCKTSSTSALRRQTRGNIKVGLEENMIAGSDGVVGNPIQCGNCGIKFPNPSACERHKKKCVVNTDHQLCHHCGKSFSYTTHFWKHIKSCRSLLHAASAHNQSIALKPAVPLKDVGKKSTVAKRSVSNSPAKRKSSKTLDENLKVNPSFSDTDDRMPALEKVLPIVDTKRVTRSKKSGDLSDIPVLSPVSNPLVLAEGEGNSTIEEYSKRNNRKGKTIRSVSESRLVEMNRSAVLSKENISDMDTLSFDDKDTVKRSRSLTNRSVKLSVADGRLHKGTKKESPKRKNRNLSKNYEIPISKLEAQFAEVVNIIDDSQESTSESTAESQDKDDMDSIVIGTKVSKGIHSKERGNAGVDTATVNKVTGELETVTHMKKVGNTINIKHQQTCAVSNENTFFKLLPSGKPMLKDRTASVKKRCRSVPETGKLGQNSENSSANSSLDSNILVGNVRRRRSMSKSLKIEFQALPAPTEYIQPAKLSSQKSEAGSSSIQEPRRNTKRRSSLMKPESPRKENFVCSHPRSKSETKVSETSDVESHQFQNIDRLKGNSVINSQVRRRRSCTAVMESESQPPSADSSRSEKMESPENCGSSTEDSLNTDIQGKVARHNKARFSNPEVDISQSHYSPDEVVSSSLGKQDGRRSRSRSSRSSLQIRDGSLSSEATEFDESSVEYPQGDLVNSVNSKTSRKRSPTKAARADLAVLNGFSSVEYSNEQSFESSTEESVDGSLKEENKKYRNRARKLGFILSETSQESSEIHEVTDYVQESMQNKRIQSRKVIKNANLSVKTDVVQLSKDTLLGTTDTAQFNEESTQDDPLNNSPTKRQRKKHNRKATKVQLEACDILQYSEFTEPEESQDLFQNHEYVEDINQNSGAVYGKKKIKRRIRPITTGLEVSNLPNSSKSDSELNILQSNKSLGSVIGSHADAVELPFSNTSHSSVCTEHYKSETTDSEADPSLSVRQGGRKVQVKNSKTELQSAQISQSSEWIQLEDNPDRDVNDCAQVRRKQNRSRSKGGKAKQQVSNVEVVDVSELEPISCIDRDCKEKVLNGTVKQKTRRRIQPKVSEIELISNTSLSSEYTEAEELKELHNVGEYLDNMAVSSNRTNKKKRPPTLGTGYSRNTNTKMELHQLNEVNFDNGNLKSRKTNNRKSVYIENEKPFQICASRQDTGNSSPEIKKRNRSRTKSPKISQFSGATEIEDQSSLESSLMDEFLEKDSMNYDVQNDLTTCNTSQISDASQSEKLGKNQNIIESQTTPAELNVLQSPNVVNSVSGKLKKGKKQSRPRNLESELNMSGISTSPEESLYLQNNKSLNHDLQSEMVEKQNFGYSQDKTMASNDKVELGTSGAQRKIKKVRDQNKLFNSQLKPSNIMKLSLQHESENLQDLVNSKLQGKKKKGKSQTDAPGLDLQSEKTSSQLDPGKLLGEAEVNDILNSYLIKRQNEAESQLNTVLMSEMHGGGLPFQILTGKKPHTVEMSHMDEGRKSGLTVVHDKAENVFKCKSKIRKSVLQSREIQMVPHLGQEPLELIHHLDSHRNEFTGSPGLEKKKKKKKYRSRTKCVNAKFQIQEIDVDLGSSNLSQPLALDEIIQPIAFQEDDEENGGMQKETPIKKKLPKFKLQMLGTSLIIQHAENGQLLKTSEVSQITGTVHDEILGSTTFIKKRNKSQGKAVKSGPLIQNANELESLPMNTESSAGMVKERMESQINPENCEPNMITPVKNAQPVDLEKLSREERFAASMDEIFKCVLGEESSEVVVPVKKKNKRKSQERKFATDESMLETIEAVVRGSIEMSENCDRNEDKNTLPTDFAHIAETMENSDVQMSKNSLEKPVINSEIPDVLSVAVDAIQASLEKLKSDVGSINNKEIIRDPVKSQRRSSSENFRRRRQNSMEKGRKRKRRKSSSSAEQIMHSSDEDSLSIAELRSLNQQGVGKIMNIGVEPVHEITDCSQQSCYLNKTADLERIQNEPNETFSSVDSSHPRKSRSTKKIKARAQAVAEELGDKVSEILESVVFGKNDELDTEPFSFMEYVENGVFVDEDTLPISKFGDPVFMKQFRRQRELFENKKNTSNDLNSEADKDQISTMSHDVVPNNLPLQITSGKEFSNAVDGTEGKRSDEAAVGVDGICLNDKEISDGFIGKSLRRGRKREETTVPVFGRERSARITRWNLSYEEMYTSSDVGSETDSQEFDMTAPEETNDTLAREPVRRTLPPRKSRPPSSGRNRRSNIRKSKNLKLHWASAKYRKMRSKRKKKTRSRGTDAKNETCQASNMNSTSEDPVENRPENGLEITKSVESHLEDVVGEEISEDPPVMEESAVRQSSDNSITEKGDVPTEKKSNIHNSDCNIPVEKIENSKDLSEASGKESVVSISENSKDLLKASGKESVVSIRENSEDLLEIAGKEMVVSISENPKEVLEASGKEKVASISLDVEVADIQPNVQINSSSTDESATELVNPVELKENNETGSSSLGTSSPFYSNPENKSKEKRSVAKYYCSSCEKNFATARNLRKHKETLFHLLQEKKRSSEVANNSLVTGTEDCVEEVENGRANDQTSHEVLALVDGVNHVIGEAEQNLDSELITDNNRMEPESISKPDLVQEKSEVLVSNENMKGNQCEKNYQLHPVESIVLNADRDSKRRRISSRKKDSNVNSVTSNKRAKAIKTNYETVAVSGSLGSSVSHQDDTVASEPLSSGGKYQIEDSVEEVENSHVTDQTSHEVFALVDGVNHVIGEVEQSLDSELITDNNRMDLESMSKPDLVQEEGEVIVINASMKENQCGKDHQLHPVESEVVNSDRKSKRRRISSRRKDSNVDSMTSKKTTKDIETNDETVTVSGSFGPSVSHQDDTVLLEQLSSDGKYQTKDCAEEVENGRCATDQTSHEVLALVDGVSYVIGEAEQNLDCELVTDNNRLELESISKPDLVQEGSEVVVSNENMEGNECGKDHQLHPVESEVLKSDYKSKRRQISSRRKDSNVDSMTNKTTKDIETSEETVIVSGSLGSTVSRQDDTVASEPLSSDGKCLLVNSSYVGGTSDENQIEKCATEELPAEPEPLDQTEKSLETMSIADTSIASSCKAIPGDLTGVSLGWSLSEESMAANDLALLTEESTPINTALADNYETFSSELVTQFSSVPSAPLEAESLDPEQIQLGDQPLNPPAEQICWTDNLQNKEGEWCQDIVAKDTDLTEQQDQQPQEEQQTTSSTQPVTITWTNGDSSQKEAWGDLEKLPEANWSEQQRANSTQWTEQNHAEIASWPSVEQPALENSNWTNNGDQQQPWPNADGPVVNWPAPDGWIGEPPRTWLWPSGNNTVEWGQQQNQAESTVCPWPTDPDSAQFYNQMEGNASLGTIMDTVNQVLHQEVLPPQSSSGPSEYPLYSYSEDATPSPAAPLASLRELQKAMGATDEEMVILQRLGERTLESNWPLENAEIIDLDKHQQGDAPTPPPPPPPPSSADPGAQKSNSDSDSAPAVKTPPPASASTPRKRNLPLRMVLGRNGRPKEYSPARDTSLMHEYQDKEMVCPLCHRFFLGLTALQTHVSSTHNQDETGKTQRVVNRSRKTFSSLLSASPNEPGTNSPRVLCPVCRELLQDEASLVRHREEMHNPSASNDADAKDPSQQDDNSKASSEGGGGEEPGAEGLKIKMTTALGDLFDRALSNLLEKGRLAGAAKDGASLNSLSLLQMTIKRSAGLDKKGSEGEAQPSTSRHNAKKLLGRRRNSGGEGKAPEVDRPFACPVCDDRFVILSTRNRHIARAHNNRLTAVEDRSSVSSPMSTLASTDDPSEEPTLDELDSAWREASPADWSVEPTEGDSEAGSFLCSDCGINFETPQDVLQHRKLEHSGRSEAVKDKLGTREPATAQGSGEHTKNLEDSIRLGRFQKMSQILSSVTRHLSEANEAKLKTVEARNDSGISSLSNEESSSQTAERCSSQEQPLQNNKTVNVDVSTQLIKDLSTSKESVSDSGNDMSTVSDDHLSNLTESSKNDSNLKDMDGICGGKVVELSSSIEIPILSHISESISAAVNEKLDKDADIMASRVEKFLPTSTVKDNSAAKCTAAEKTTKGTGKVGRGRSSARSLEKQMELCEDGTTIRAKAEAALRELNSRKNKSTTNPASKWGLKFTVSDSPKEKPPKKDGEGAQSDYPKKSATTDRFNFPLVRKLPVGSTRFASLAEKKKKVTNVSSVKKVMPEAEEDKMLGVSLESEVTKPQATMSFDVYEFEDEDSVPVGELGFRPLHQRPSDERPKDIEGTDKSGENDPKSAMLDHTDEQQENGQDKTLQNNEELATEVAAEILEPRYDGSKSDNQAVPAEGGHHHQEPSHDIEKKENKHEKSKESSKHKRSKKSSHEKVRRQSCHDEYLFGEHRVKSNEECHKSEFVPSDYINSEEDNDITIKKSRKERGKKEHRKKKSHKRSEEHVHLSTEHSQKRKCEKDSSVKKQSKFKKSSENNDLQGMTCNESVPVEGGDSVSKKESRKHSKKRRLPSENSSDETSDVALHESRRRTSSKHEHLKKRHKKRKHRYSMSSASGFIEKHKTNYDSDDDKSLILSAKEVSSGRRYFVDDDDDETTNCSSDRGEDSSEQTKRAAARRRRTKSDLLISVFAKSKRNCLMNNSALRSKSFLTISSKDRDQTLSSSDESDVCDKRRSLNSSGHKNRTVSSSEVI